MTQPLVASRCDIWKTTITLDGGLARQLKDEMRARGTGFRETLEETLERGLANKAVHPNPEAFRVRAKPMRLKTGIDPSHSTKGVKRKL